MKRTKSRIRVVTALVAIALVAGACADGDDDDAAATSGASGVVNISGSSTVEPISVRVAELLADQNDAIGVNVDGPGTGDGFKLFCNGETEISDASRAIKDEEARACADAGIEFIELKIANDGIAVLTHPDNDLDCLSTADLYALAGPESEGFENWTDAASLARDLGSDTAFPDAALEMTAPGEESGTYDAFVELALAGPAEARVEAGSITEDQAEGTRKDYTSQSNDDAIIQGIQGSKGSFGWVGFAFALNAGEGVKTVAVENAEGTCIEPSPETIADYSYPLARPLYLYVDKAEAEANPGLAAYVDFYLGDGYTAVEEVGYVALDASELDATKKRWADRTTGTAGE